jgi:hypothetical protein
MLKTAPDSVLVAHCPQRTPEGTPVAPASSAALLDRRLEHPPLISAVVQLRPK